MAKAKKEPEQEDLIEKIDAVNIQEQIKNEMAAEEVEEPQEDSALALQKQLDELKKSEEIQRNRAEQAGRDRDNAILKAREREVQINRFQKEAEISQFDAISSGLTAANAEAEKAQLDIENAISIGDTKSQAEAYRKLARAETNIARLEDGKFAIESRRIEEAAQPKQSNDPVGNSDLPDNAKTWLRDHPEYMSDRRKNARIQSLHYDVIDEGHRAFSTEYFQALEQHLGMKTSPPWAAREEEPQQKIHQRTSIVSAPVSREATTSISGTKSAPRLTVLQREAAKTAGITEVEYAKQLQRLNEMKANGTYGDRQ